VNLLEPGPQMLATLTGLPLLGVLPMLADHALPEEDGVMSFERGHDDETDATEIVVIATPRASNLDEFAALRRLPGVRLRWAREAAQAQTRGWLVLPGSKQVSGDLRWLRERGIADAVLRHAARGRPVLGICGGMQMLGARLIDADGADGEAGVDMPGLDLLPLATHYAGAKRVRRSHVGFDNMQAPWAALRGVAVDGYEIRVGHTEASDSRAVIARADDGVAVGWQRGNVLGTALHGLLESGDVLHALLSCRAPSLDDGLDALADVIAPVCERGPVRRALLG
jgi:adenosylcobyric acid synthase